MTTVLKSTKILFPQSYTSLETLPKYSINSNLSMLKFLFCYIYLGLHIC